jgi:hypothetical protein
LVLEYYLAMRAVFSDRPHLRPCRVSCRHCGILFITYPCNQHRTNLRCPFGCREAHKKKSSNERVAAYYKTESGWKKKKALNSKRSKHAPKSNATGKQGKQTGGPEPAEPGTSPAPLEQDTTPQLAAPDTIPQAVAQEPRPEPKEPETRTNLEEPDTRAVRPVPGPSIETGPQEEAPGQEEQEPSPTPEEAGTSIANEEIQFDAGMVKYVQLVTSLIEGRRVSRDEILQMLRRVMRQRSLDTDRQIDYGLRHLKENPP